VRFEARNVTESTCVAVFNPPSPATKSGDTPEAQHGTFIDCPNDRVAP
jgi:hypothetical protein